MPIGGGVIMLLSVAALAALAMLDDAPQALNAVAGGWVFVSPWALKFQGTTALSVNLAIGTIVVLLAGIELWSMFPIELRQITDLAAPKGCERYLGPFVTGAARTSDYACGGGHLGFLCGEKAPHPTSGPRAPISRCPSCSAA